MNVTGRVLPCGALELVLQYVGGKTWLCMGSVSQEWQALYIMLYGAKKTSRKQMQLAVRGGHLSMVQYLYESRCSLYKSCCDDAVRFGHVDILRFLLEHGDCVLKDDMCAWAAFYDQPNMLRFLHERGLALDKVCIYGSECVELVQYLCQHGHADTLLQLSCETLVDRAARRDNTDLLEWAHADGGMRLTWRACWEAAKHGHLSTVEYMFDMLNDEPADEFHCCLCIAAAHSGFVEVLQFLVGKGFLLESNALKAALQSDHINSFSMVKYLIDSGCPSYPDAILDAVLTGDVNIVRFMHENGSPLDERAMPLAVRYSGDVGDDVRYYIQAQSF
jgi:hypothetical protein